MSDRWCDDCAWPEECAADMCCRRRDAGEIRSAAPSEKVAKIEAGMTADADRRRQRAEELLAMRFGEIPPHIEEVLRDEVAALDVQVSPERALRLGRLRMFTPVKRGDVFRWSP